MQGEAIKEMSQQKLAVDERVEDGEWRWRMNSVRSSAMVLVFSSTLLIGHLQK